MMMVMHLLEIQLNTLTQWVEYLLQFQEVWNQLTNEPTMSYAAKTSIMGATVAAGVSQIDVKAGTDKDPSFVTVGYSIAGLNLGYALYDSDDWWRRNFNGCRYICWWHGCWCSICNL